MTRRFSIAAFVAALAVPALGQYPTLIAIDLHDGSANNSRIRSVSPVDQVGSLGGIATRWTYPFGAPIGVAGTPSFLGTDGGNVTGALNGKAGYWIFTTNPPTFVPLHIVKLHTDSFARASFSGQYVGGAVHTRSGALKAVYWPSSTGRPQHLHPSAYVGSAANAVTLNWQVGTVNTTDPWPSRAAIWQGRAQTFVNAHPAGYLASAILGAYADSGVGYVIDASQTPHPFLWHLPSGTGGEIAGVFQGSAEALDEDMAVGWHAFDGGVERAALWNLYVGGTYLDLHDLLPAGEVWTNSRAHSIHRNASTGETVIGGYATEATTGVRHAMLWTTL